MAVNQKLIIVDRDDLQELLKEHTRQIVSKIEHSQNESRYLTRHQVAVYLNIALSTVDSWSRLGRLKKIYLDGSVRFDKEQLDKMLQQ